MGRWEDVHASRGGCACILGASGPHEVDELVLLLSGCDETLKEVDRAPLDFGLACLLLQLYLEHCGLAYQPASELSPSRDCSLV